MNLPNPTNLNDAHLHRMVDDTGIYQHAKFSLPNPKEGYTTDDNARLMMMAALYYEVTGRKQYLDMAYRALGFLMYAEKDGWFRNFMGFDRRFLEERGSQDCFGRCIWCLGYVVSRTELPEGLRSAADALLRNTVEGVNTLEFIRSNAYATMGLALWNADSSEQLMEKPLSVLTEAYNRHKQDNWHWFEDEITYCNAALPHAYLTAYRLTKKQQYLDIGQESLQFLLGATMREGVFWPVGCNGWCPKNEEPAPYDQQPVEACGTLLACLTAHSLTGDEQYLDAAQRCLGWFVGENSAKVSMIDPDSGGCYDGLRKNGPNRNQGSESLLSWYVSSLSLAIYPKQHKGGS